MRFDSMTHLGAGFQVGFSGFMKPLTGLKLSHRGD